jgi:hypothetical protein
MPLFLFSLLHFDYCTIIHHCHIWVVYRLVPISVVRNNWCIQSAVVCLQCFLIFCGYIEA